MSVLDAYLTGSVNERCWNLVKTNVTFRVESKCSHDKALTASYESWATVDSVEECFDKGMARRHMMMYVCQRMRRVAGISATWTGLLPAASPYAKQQIGIQNVLDRVALRLIAVQSDLSPRCQINLLCSQIMSFFATFPSRSQSYWAPRPQSTEQTASSPTIA